MTRISCQPLQHIRLHLSKNVRFDRRVPSIRHSRSLCPISTDLANRYSHSLNIPRCSQRPCSFTRAVKQVTRTSFPTLLRMSTISTTPPGGESKECTPEMKDIEDSLRDPYLKPGAPWGFVIYRVAYGDGTDEKWCRMLQMLKKDVENDLELNSKTQTLGSRHQTVLMVDEESFNAMTTHDVRTHFRYWAADELELWLAQRPSVEEMTKIRTGVKASNDITRDAMVGCRWNICVYVDEECLDSLDSADGFPEPKIKLVWKNWTPQETPVDDKDIDDEMPPEVDIGWTYLRANEYNWMYGMLCDYNRKYEEYCIAAQRLGVRILGATFRILERGSKTDAKEKERGSLNQA